MAKWQKGMRVFLKRRGYGTNSREIDYRYKYIIRSIGKKQAILDRVYTEEETNRYRYSGRRGQAYHITPPEQVENWRRNHPGEELPTYYNEYWSDIFVPAGDENWDADENYAWS